jgi:hypothetical protein
MAFLVPALLSFVVGLLMTKAKDPAAKGHAEEFMVE